MKRLVRLLAAMLATTTTTPLPAQYVDRGIGVLGVIDSIMDVRTDTIPILAMPDDPAVIARWIRVVEFVEGERHLLLRGETTIAAPVLEYGYDVSGFVVDSLDASGHWARVQIGDTSAPASRHGWIDLRHPRVDFLHWASYLSELDGVFSLDPARLVLHRTPGGARLTRGLVRRFDADDHWLEILERRGDWLRVRLTQPAMICGAEPVRDGVTVEGWIRFLDGRGRPLVWYYTRGC
jgi:hypothetical protein